MTEDLTVLEEAVRLLKSGEPFVMATVVTCKGSTPRNPGARMIWRPGSAGTASGELFGTVGGGQFEHLVLDAARGYLQKRSGGTEHYVLGADADQCCGGVMDVFFEYYGARRRVVIFGAGHVSREVAELLGAAPLEVVIVDDRPEWNSTERFPRAHRVHDFEQGVRLSRECAGATLACVMTCSHDTDFDLLRGVLAPGAIPAFVGLIGSMSKRACLFGRLVASGMDDSAIARIKCPLGVGDTGKEPKLVAVSIAAQLLIESRALPQL